MPQLFRRKRTVALASVLALLAVAGAAFAYFSSTGSGSATGTVGSSSGLTVNGSLSGSLYPGAATSISFTAVNPSPGQEYLGTIHLNSVSVDSNHTGCSTAWFTMPDVTADQDIPTSGSNGTPHSVTATGLVSMSDGNGVGSNQDACQGATITFGFTTS